MGFDVSLDLYKVFCTVVQTGNMSHTAKQLFISQPAVSMSIKQLEEKLGKPLLVRSSKGIRTTPEGKVLYDYLNQALTLIDTAEVKYQEMVNLKLGDIIIGASDTLLSNFLMPYIEKFVHINTKINIKVKNTSSKDTIELLKSGQIDIGFVNLPIEKDETLEVVKIMDIQDTLIGGVKYKHLVKKGVTLEELNDNPLIMINQGCNARRNLDQLAREKGIKLVPNIELSSSDSLIKFAKINLGIAVVVKEFSEDDIDNKDIFEIPMNPPIQKRSIGMALLKGVEPSHATLSFIKLMGLK